MVLKRYQSVLLGLVMLLALLPGPALAADKPTGLMLTAPGRASVGDVVTLTATLSRVRSNEKAKYLEEQVIRFVVDGVEVGTAVTNPTTENQNKDELSGQATFDYVVTVGPGSHTVWAYFDGNDKYEPASNFSVIQVKLPEQEWTRMVGRMSATTVRQGETVQIAVSLMGQATRDVSGRTIILQVDKQEVARGVTDDNGKVVFDYQALLAAGGHPIGLFFEGDDQFARSSLFMYLIVK